MTIEYAKMQPGTRNVLRSGIEIHIETGETDREPCGKSGKSDGSRGTEVGDTRPVFLFFLKSKTCRVSLDYLDYPLDYPWIILVN